MRLIEKHSEELVGGLTEQIHLSERTADFRRIPAAELELAAAEVHRNLGEWLADRHREDHNYVVAYAVYTRALSVAQQIHTPENVGNVLLARIRTDQQAAFDLLRIGGNGLEKSFLPLA